MSRKTQMQLTANSVVSKKAVDEYVDEDFGKNKSNSLVWLFWLGFLCPPVLWILGGALFLRTPDSHSRVYGPLCIGFGFMTLITFVWGLHV